MELYFYEITWNCDETWSETGKYKTLYITDKVETIESLYKSAYEKHQTEGLKSIYAIRKISYEEFVKDDWYLPERESELVSKYEAERLEKAVGIVCENCQQKNCDNCPVSAMKKDEGEIIADCVCVNEAFDIMEQELHNEMADYSFRITAYNQLYDGLERLNLTGKRYFYIIDEENTVLNPTKVPEKYYYRYVIESDDEITITKYDNTRRIN